MKRMSAAQRLGDCPGGLRCQTFLRLNVAQSDQARWAAKDMHKKRQEKNDAACFISFPFATLPKNNFNIKFGGKKCSICGLQVRRQTKQIKLVATLFTAKLGRKNCRLYIGSI